MGSIQVQQRRRQIKSLLGRLESRPCLPRDPCSGNERTRIQKPWNRTTIEHQPAACRGSVSGSVQAVGGSRGSALDDRLGVGEVLCQSTSPAPRRRKHILDKLFETVIAPELEKMKNALFDRLGELTACSKRGGHSLPARGFLSHIQRLHTGRQLAMLNRHLGLSDESSQSSNGRSFDVDDLVRAISHLQSSSEQSEDIIDQMQIYYDVSWAC